MEENKRLKELIGKDNPTRNFTNKELSEFENILIQNSILFNSIPRQFSLPKSFIEFKEQILNFHSILFNSLPLKDIGSFREETVFYGNYPHEREGSPYHEIESRLENLWKNNIEILLKKNTQDKRILSLYLASFLSEFFRIHPFRDGNGRVARMFIKSIFYFFSYNITFNNQSEYLKSLKHSHKRYDEEFSDYKSGFITILKLQKINKNLIKYFQKNISIITIPKDVSEDEE